MKKLVLILSFFIAFQGFSQVTEVVNAEKSFAQYALDHSTRQAFLRYMDTNAVVFNRGVISNGIAYWQPLPEGKGKLIWGPSYAAISASGDLGFTTGAYEARASLQDTVRGSGQYTTVWNKKENGEWKFLVDLGTGYSPSQWDKQPFKTFEMLVPAEKNDTSMMELEQKFIKSFTAEGFKAYRPFITNDSWLNFNGQPPLYNISFEKLSFIPAGIHFIPVEGSAAASKDLGYVYGTVELDGKKENYLRIWGHTKMGWKLLVQVLKY